MRKTRAETTVRISDAEEAAIQRGIASDADNPEWTDEDFARAKPFSEVFPALAEDIRRARGPGRKPRKRMVTLRLDPDIVAAYKAEGEGWQSRVNADLRKLKRLPG